MSMIRTHKRENPFVQLDKSFIGNGRLSLKATGLLTYFLSKPDDWQIYMKDVQNKFADGETSIRSAMTELLNEGFIYRWRERNEKGQLGSYNYEVYERPEFNPHFGEEKEEKKKVKKTSKKSVKKKKEKPVKTGSKEVAPKRENPVLDDPVLDDPVLENQALTNNDLTDIDLTNNDLTDINLSINERDITELDIPIGIQKQMILNIDRLIDDSISIYSIQALYKAYENKINQHEFSLILGNVLESTKGQIKNIKQIMIKSINNHIEPSQQAENDTEVSKEIVPDWFKDRNKKKETSYDNDYGQYDFSKRKNPDWMTDEQKEIEKLMKGIADA